MSVDATERVMLTPQQAASALSISRPTLLDWVNRQHVTAYDLTPPTPGRQRRVLRFAADEIQQFIEDRKLGSGDE